MSNDYRWHFAKARQEWVNKFYNQHNESNEDFSEYRRAFEDDPDALAMYDDELRYALESFDETAEQVKFIRDRIHGTCLKVKWEHSPWWDGDKLHFYYCVLLPLDGLAMVDPVTLEQMKPKQRKLFWWA